MAFGFEPNSFGKKGVTEPASFDANNFGKLDTRTPAPFGFNANNFGKLDTSSPQPARFDANDFGKIGQADGGNDSAVAAGATRTAANTGIDRALALGGEFQGGQDRMDVLDRGQGHSFSSADIEGRMNDIRTQIQGNRVSDEILSTLPAELRSAAEPVVEAEMRRLGHNPDETAAQRDTRVAEEQQQIQQGIGAAITGAGLTGALDGITGQNQQPTQTAGLGQGKEEPQKTNDHPFAGLFAGMPKLACMDMGSTGACLADHNNLNHGLAKGPEQRERSAVISA